MAKQQPYNFLIYNSPVLVVKPIKHTISLDLTTKEKEVLDQLAKDQELPPEKVMIQALRSYQLQTNPVIRDGKLWTDICKKFDVNDTGCGLDTL